MITPAQLRAARGLLDWTRSELAKASGLSAETIKNIEHGIYTPQETTIAAIIKTFAEHGVEFTENEGIRKSANIVVHYEGKADFRRYADDIYSLLQKNEGNRDICIFGNNDKEFLEALGEYAPIHLGRMAKLNGLHFRTLIMDGIPALVNEYIEYRCLSELAFTIPFSVYANRFDFIIYGEGNAYPKVVAITSQTVADAYRSQFEALWNIATAVKK